MTYLFSVGRRAGVTKQGTTLSWVVRALHDLPRATLRQWLGLVTLHDPGKVDLHQVSGSLLHSFSLHDTIR